MDCFLKPHTTFRTTKDCWVFSFWFQAPDKLNCCSHVADQLYSPLRPIQRSTAVSRKPFLTRFTNSSFKKYPSKVDRWLENVNRQKWKPDDHIKGHIWSVCMNTDNNEHGFVRLSSMTSNFLDNTCTKIQNIAFKTSQMDQIALEYWYYGFLGRLRVDGRGTSPKRKSWKTVRRKEIKLPHMRRTVSQSLEDCIFLSS